MKVRVGGDVKPEHADKINDFLRRRARHDKRAQRALRALAEARDLRKDEALKSADMLIERLKNMNKMGAQRAFGGTMSVDDMAEQKETEALLLATMSLEVLSSHQDDDLSEVNDFE